jgi:hypothetical protein
MPLLALVTQTLCLRAVKTDQYKYSVGTGTELSNTGTVVDCPHELFRDSERATQTP